MTARRHNRQAASPSGVEVEARRLRALELRRAGLSYDAIAGALHVSTATAHGDVQAGLKRIGAECLEEATALRSLELSRVDRVVELATKAAEAGDVKALGVILRAVEVRARLLGLDSIPHEMTVIDGAAVLAKLREKLDRADAATARFASV